MELSELKNKTAKSKNIIAKTKDAERGALRKHRLTRTELRRFSVYRRACEFVGINFMDFEQVTNVLSLIQQLDGNPDQIINEMKKTSALEFRKYCLQKECDESEKNLEIYKKEEERRKMYKGSFSAAVDLVTDALVTVGTADEIANLFNTIVNNIGNFSLTEFTKDIDTYGGIKSAIFKIKRELEKLTTEKGNLIESTGSLDFN